MHVRTDLIAIVSLVVTFALATDTASPDDPNEISFSKGEIMDIIDKTGKWWQARKDDGSVGSTYSLLAGSHFTGPYPSDRSRAIELSSNHLMTIPCAGRLYRLSPPPLTTFLSGYFLFLIRASPPVMNAIY
jgi:SH3 domain